MNYNRGTKELNRESILQNEYQAIKKWTSKADYYKDIKKVAENRYQSKNHELQDIYLKWFDGLESLFNDYIDNTEQFEKIFRVDIIDNIFGIELDDNELFERFCVLFEVEKVFKFPDLICSFSAVYNSAKKASENSKKYRGINTPQVIYILEKRYSKYLYVEDFSDVIGEEEVLTITNGDFKVKDLKILENNNIELYIDEIIP